MGCNTRFSTLRAVLLRLRAGRYGGCALLAQARSWQGGDPGPTPRGVPDPETTRAFFPRWMVVT